MKCTNIKGTALNVYVPTHLCNLLPNQDLERKVRTIREPKDWSLTVSLKTLTGASVVTVTENHFG